MKFLTCILVCVSAFAQNTSIFPGRAATTSDLKIASNRTDTTLTQNLTAITLTLNVAATTGFTFPALLTIDSEIVNVCSKTSNTFTVCASGRGFDGSTATTHLSGAHVTGRMDAWHHNQIAAEVVAIEATITGGTKGFAAGINGGVCDGATDDTTAFQALITSLQAAGGGEIKVFSGASACRIDGPLTPVNTTGSLPTQKPIRITGYGGSANGYWGTLPASLSTLDMRYNATYGKIDTRGAGILEIDHILLKDGGSDCAPFIYTTNTSVNIHDMVFSGTASGASACNDAIVAGGFMVAPTNADRTDGATAPFQGYGSDIHNVFFDKIRRGIYGRDWFNSVSMHHLTFSESCGATSSESAIEIDGTNAVPFGQANQIESILLESSSYPYAVKLKNASGNAIRGLQVWDGGVGITGIRIMGNSPGNSCMQCFVDAPTAWLDEGNAVANDNAFTFVGMRGSAAKEVITQFGKLGIGTNPAFDSTFELLSPSTGAMRIWDSTKTNFYSIATVFSVTGHDFMLGYNGTNRLRINNAGYWALPVNTQIGWGGTAVGAGTNPGFYSDGNYINMQSKSGSPLYMNFDLTSTSSPVNFFNGKAKVERVGQVNGSSFASSSAAPAISGCGTIVAGSTQDGGQFTSATTGACATTITLPAVTVGWACAVSNLTTPNLMRQSASSTTTATFSGTTVSGDVISYGPCTGR